MDQDNSSNNSIIREGTSQVTRHIHHLMAIRAVEVVVAVAVVVEVVVSIQVIINRVLAEGMGSHRVAMEDSRVVMATKDMEVCIK